MFSQKELELYNGITAPKELYEKVENCKGKKKIISYKQVSALAGIAACFVAVITLHHAMETKSPYIKVNGLDLESSVMFYDISPASEMRMSPVVSVPVEIEVEDSAEVSVSQGMISWDLGNPSEEIEITETATLWWNIERNEKMPECEMRIKDDKNTTIITLEFDSAEKSVTAKKHVE